MLVKTKKRISDRSLIDGRMDYTQPFENWLMVVKGDDNGMAAACNGTFIIASRCL
jgi:hypothetical protein